MSTGDRQGVDGVVAERCFSVYRPGGRSPDRVETEPVRTQEVWMVGGWTTVVGERRGNSGALVPGLPHGAEVTCPLHFNGTVGTGSADAASRATVCAVHSVWLGRRHDEVPEESPRER
jgi:ATP-dependent DNA ligase